MKDENFLEKYNEIWEKISNIIKKEFNSEPVHNKQYLKTEKRFYNDKINTKEDSQFIYILVILTASGYIKDKNYCPQVFLEKCHYVVREKKMSAFITDDIEIYSDDHGDSDDSNHSDDFDEKTKMKKIKYTIFFKRNKNNMINLFKKKIRKT